MGAVAKEVKAMPRLNADILPLEQSGEVTFSEHCSKLKIIIKVLHQGLESLVKVVVHD